MTTGIETLKTRDLKPRIGTEISPTRPHCSAANTPTHCGSCWSNAACWYSRRSGSPTTSRSPSPRPSAPSPPNAPGEKLYNVTLDTTVNAQADYLKGSLYWHIDGTMNEVPIRASLLTSKVLPSDGGGDTEFCNTYAAYDGLSDEDKAELHGLTAMHSAWNTLFYFDPEPDLTHLR